MRSIWILLLLSYPTHLLTFMIFRTSAFKFAFKNFQSGSNSPSSVFIGPNSDSSEKEVFAFISALETLQLSTSTKRRRNENISLKDRKQLNKNEYDLADISSSIDGLRFEVLSLDQISSLCHSLGYLGISNLDFTSSVWNVLENHIGSIKSVSLTETNGDMTDQPDQMAVTDSVQSLPSDKTLNNNDENNLTEEKEKSLSSPKMNRIYLDLLSGLAGMGVKWKSLSLNTRQNMETIICELLSQYTNAPKKSELFTLIINIGYLNIPYKELKTKTKLQISESIVFLTHGLPTSKSLSDVLFSMGNIGINFLEDFSSNQQHKLKISFSKQFNRNLHQNKFWKGLQGLGEIGIKWSNSDVNFRYSKFFYFFPNDNILNIQ